MCEDGDDEVMNCRYVDVISMSNVYAFMTWSWSFSSTWWSEGGVINDPGLNKSLFVNPVGLAVPPEWVSDLISNTIVFTYV